MSNTNETPDLRAEFTGHLVQSGSNIYMYHVPVPDDIAQNFIKNDAKRVFCSLNGNPEYQCGLIPIGNGAFGIMINKPLRTKLKLTIEEPVHLAIRKDDSEYGLPVPEELIEAMAQDEQGESLFNALTPGKRRTLLYVIASIKNSEGRIRRSLIILDHLKRQNGKIDYKKLNEDLKVKD